ncbi:MAG: Fic family protein [Pseudomonadota bacterium]
MFEGMTPSTCTCIVGNYRGTGDCPDLTHCPVGVDDDHRLGFDPALVGIAMVDLEEQFVQVMDVYHVWLKGDGQSATPERQLKKFVVKAAYIFERFLTIHPYIDGNGHCARLMLFRMLTWAGFPPVQWDIDQKLPLYEQIKDHRKGQRGPLMVALTVFIASVL